MASEPLVLKASSLFAVEPSVTFLISEYLLAVPNLVPHNLKTAVSALLSSVVGTISIAGLFTAALIASPETGV